MAGVPILQKSCLAWQGHRHRARDRLEASRWGWSCLHPWRRCPGEKPRRDQGGSCTIQIIYWDSLKFLIKTSDFLRAPRAREAQQGREGGYCIPAGHGGQQKGTPNCQITGKRGGTESGSRKTEPVLPCAALPGVPEPSEPGAGGRCHLSVPGEGAGT